MTSKSHTLNIFSSFCTENCGYSNTQFCGIESNASQLWKTVSITPECIIYSEKQLKDIKNSFDLITFGNIIFKQIIFVIDRIITMQFTKMQLKFTGHWLRYSTTPNVPTLSTQNSQAKHLALSIYAETFTRSLLMFLIRPQKKVNTNLSVISPNNGTTSSTKIHGYGIPRQI